MVKVSIWVRAPKSQEHDYRRTGGDGCLSSRRKTVFALPSLFCCIQTLNGLDDARPRWGGPSALFSLPTQMLICFRKHPHRHGEIMPYQRAGRPLAQTN